MNASESHWQRAQTVFASVLELAAERRDQAVAAACGDDAALRAKVEMLLRGHAAAIGGFLEPPGVDAVAASLAAGLHLGSCRLVQQIGEGGMGTVWQAHDEALGRDVAVKVLHAGLLGQDAVRRFTQEAAALARLHHPGIAAVHACGQLPGGPLAPPYFVLDLVADALPITVWASRVAASRAQRLQLLAQVADAIQHAHQRGVVHRDLKPGNVLVGQDGQPRVIDFGIARLRDGDGARQTRQGQVLGTPAYLSPEQCAGDPDLVDARTDVHALGVLGIELLTGRLPYAVERAPLTEALQTVRFGTPARPRALDPDLPPELDAVLWKAIAKDPADRYASAAALADDLRAVLASRPVQARPPGVWTAVRLFVRRSPALAAAVAGVVLALLAGSLVSTWFGLRAADRAAVAERQRAIAEQLADSLRDLVRSANLGITGRDVTMREALDAAATTIDARLREQPVVAVELHLVLGDAYRVLGRLAEADRQFTAAQSALDRAPGDRRELQARLDLAAAVLRALQNRPDDVESLVQRALAVRSELHGAGSPQVAEVRGRHGALLGNLGRHRQAEAACRAALAGLPAEPPTLLRAEVLASLGNARFQQGDPAEAESCWREALAAFDALVPAEHPHRLKTLGALANAVRSRDPQQAIRILREVAAATERHFPDGHSDTAQVRSQLAFALLDADDPAAEAEFRAVLALRKQLHGDEHRATAGARNDLGYCLLALDRPAEARTELRPAWQHLQALPDLPDTSGAALLLGLAETRAGDPASGEPLLRSAVAARTRIFGAANPRTHNAQSALGECLVALGRAGEAEPLLVAAEAVLRQAFGPDHRECRAARARLAAAYRALGRHADAERFRDPR